jgi:hypothetical protein
METVSAKCSDLSFVIVHEFYSTFKEPGIFNDIILVGWVPDTCKHSHDCIAKKNAPVNNWHVVYF